MTEPLPAARPITGRFVLAALLGFFAVVLVANVVLVRTALSSFGGVEVESAYKAGRLFGDETRAARHQSELGWDVALTLDPAARRLLIDARDRDGRPLAGLVGSIAFQHPADRRLDGTADITATGIGAYQAALPAAAGLRIADLTLKGGDGRIFRSQNRLMLPATDARP